MTSWAAYVSITLTMIAILTFRPEVHCALGVQAACTYIEIEHYTKKEMRKDEER